MMGSGRIMALLCVIGSVSAVRAQDDPLKLALAMEGAVQKALDKAEPSIACILVSRNSGYAKFEKNVRPPVRREPGRLGWFDPPAEPGFQPKVNPDMELARRLNLAAPEVVPDSYGSGVVIDSAGYVLTNYHVVKDATKVFVRLPGKEGSYADIHAADERSDLAVLKLIRPPAGLKPLVMGDGDAVRKGQFVLAVANPFAAGFRDGSPSVSWGMLSNVRRRLPGEPNEGDRRRPRLHYYGVLLQTDIRLNLGCSGGALLDLHGNWIGLTTSLAGLAGGESAGGFAVPLDRRMKRIISRLRDGLEVEYGFLGITQGAQTAGWRPSPGGPAAKAGMRDGDRIISVDGYPINDQDDLLFNIAAALAGTEIRMVVEAPFGQRREIRPVLTKASWPYAGPLIALGRPEPVFGLRVDYTSTKFLPTGNNTTVLSGVLVREIVEASPAAKAGLEVDKDIILAVNGRQVNSPAEFYAACANAASIELTLAEGARQVKLP